MKDTSTTTGSLDRILDLMQELEQEIPAKSVSARRSLEELVNRLTAPLSPELRAAVRNRSEAWRPRAPR